MIGKLNVDDALIRHLAALLEQTGLSEIEIRRGRQQVRVARHGAANGATPPAVAAPAPAIAAPVTEEPAEIDESHPGAVCSPMVGTVYLAPEPGTDPFITVGANLREGDTMFIIEAMKTMNPVRAPRAGKVARILVENAAPVEYGEVLALLE